MAGTAALTLSMAVLVSGGLAGFSDKAIAVNSATLNSKFQEKGLAPLLPTENGAGCVPSATNNCISGIPVWPQLIAPQSGKKLGAQCTGDNLNVLWVLGPAGQVQRVENGKTTATFDIPEGQYRWTHGGNPPQINNGVEGRFWFRQMSKSQADSQGGSYNGLGITADSVFVLESGPSPDSSSYSGKVLIHEFDFSSQTWSQLDRKNKVVNTWKSGKVAGSDFSFNFSPRGYGSSPYTGTTAPSVGNYSFKDAYANFLMGDARPDGTYIMAGYTAPIIQGEISIKLFARKPDGSIAYLGYAPYKVDSGKNNTSIAVKGDIQFDTEGNLQLFLSRKIGSKAYQPSVDPSMISAYTISVDELNDKLANPSAIWNPKVGTGQWQESSTGRIVHLNDNSDKGPSSAKQFSLNPLFERVLLPDLVTASTGAMDAASFASDGTVVVAFTATAFDNSGTGSGPQTVVLYQIDPKTGKVVKSPNTGVTSSQMGKPLPALFDSSQNQGTGSVLVDGGSPLSDIVDMAGCPTPKSSKHDIEVKKVDPKQNLDSEEDDVPLEGAKFKLYKDDGTLTEGKPAWNENSETKLYVDLDGNIVDLTNPDASDELTTKEDGIATWKGLETGNYWLVETQPPANYIGISEPILIEITDESEKVLKRTVNNSPSSLFQCKAGDIYSLTERGWLQKIEADGSVKSVGSRMGLNFVSQNGNYRVANSLGITKGGEKAYAIERQATYSRFSDKIYVWTYDAKAAQWQRSTYWDTRDSQTDGSGASIVAGAVDPITGHYAFGGFYEDGDFFIWDYDPDTKVITKKGKLATKNTETDVNGDMAFDSEGNLMITRGAADPSNTNNGLIVIYSITAENYKKANSNRAIPGSETLSFVTKDLRNVNGVTFDSTGKAFLSNAKQLASFDMPNWANKQLITNSLSNVSHQETYWYQDYYGWHKYNRTIAHGVSTDLASCSYPPTITVKKNLPNGRVVNSDQFKLTLKQGATSIAEMETSGDTNGIQEQQIGPFPTVGGAKLTIEESGIGNTKLNHYTTSFKCIADNSRDFFVEGEKLPADITIPVNAKSVTCTVTNTANLQGSLQFEKHGYYGPSVPDASTLTDDSLLGDSEWKLALKGANKSWNITDCQSAGCKPAAAGEPYDSDPAKGKFNITKLAKGDYILTETKAPAGFAVGTDGPFVFKIGPDSQNATLTNHSGKQLPKRNGVQIIFNAQRNAPGLPLSGGLGRDYFLIAGGAILAAGAVVVLLLGRKRSIVRDLG
ncbi:Cna protein B-type domain-containing protein [Arcanobacterium phocae]|uniref:Cna protein B-type domain-containing protein n=1 Tax=Arcanobacterium phocae TaxID=131112 RepID=A0A1H2LBJ5_9ACTO|nr:Cna protein B-type domain-containing protein [Arcanobacterium phocae]